MKILAFADLHLDSAFSSYPENERAERKGILMQVFSKICNECRQRNADLLLIGGDLFDVPTPSPACTEFVASELASLRINVIIAPGNHDYYIPGEVYDHMPENVHVFKNESLSRISFESLAVNVDGYAFHSDTHAPIRFDTSDMPKANGTKLLLAHTDIFSKNSPYAYISPEDLASESYTFSFLGHVHTDTDTHVVGNARYAYSGIPQGRSIDEPIEGGIREIDIIDGKIISNELIYVWEWKNLIYDISADNATSDAEIIRRIEDIVEVGGVEPMDVLRIILVGEHGFYYVPNDAIIQKQIQKRLKGVSVSLKNNAIPQINREELLSDPSIIGVLYRTLFENEEYLEKYTQDQRTRAFRLALAAMRGDQLNYENI